MMESFDMRSDKVQCQRELFTCWGPKASFIRKGPGNNPAAVVNDAEVSLSSYIQPYPAKGELI